MAQLKHVNIVRLMQVIREKDQIHMVIEYCDCSLYQCMQSLKNKAKNLSEDQIRWAMKEVLNGIGHLHDKGYIHRDIKPENMLITDSNLKLCDFGQVKPISSRYIGPWL